VNLDNVPPLQPHRAPAGPMFSSEDAEFGPKPRKANKSGNADAQRGYRDAD